jgi:putative ABC transport system permease protein
MVPLCGKVDEAYANSDSPTKTQTEEAFGQMFAEMAGDFQWIIVFIGLAVGISLLCVSANAMAMALRERTTEIAVLKAIGFGKALIVTLILAESVMIAGIGGLVGAVGIKLFCDYVDLSKYSAGMLPFFYVPWSTAIGGLVVAVAIGVFSGLVPALRASRLSVVNGLRKVV